MFERLRERVTPLDLAPSARWRPVVTGREERATAMINCNLVWMETEAGRRKEEVERAVAAAALRAEAAPPRQALRPALIGLRQRVGHGLIATGERVAGRPVAPLREAA